MSYNTLGSSPSISTIDTFSLSSNTGKKYSRIFPEIKDKLFQMVCFDGKKVKEAADFLKINYSSAKTLLHLHRKKMKSNNKHGQQAVRRCQFRTGKGLINIVCSQAGKIIQKESSLIAKYIRKELRPQTTIFQNNFLVHSNTAFIFHHKTITP